MKTGSTKSGNFQLTKNQRIIELSRPWLLLCGYIWLAYLQVWWLAIPVAFATCLAAFVQLHDSIHNALGLSKKGHDLTLSLSALLLLKSGHALKVTHLRHHGQCLSDDEDAKAQAPGPARQPGLPGRSTSSR